LDALGVVPAVDIGEQRVLRLVSGPPGFAVDEFGLESGEEVLSECVVVGITDPIGASIPWSPRCWANRKLV
jgi:hypothetical protein